MISLSKKAATFLLKSLFFRKLFVYLHRVSSEHDILFAHSPLELGPRKVNGQYLLPRDLRLSAGFPWVVEGGPKPEWRMVKPCTFLVPTGLVLLLQTNRIVLTY